MRTKLSLQAAAVGWRVQRQHVSPLVAKERLEDDEPFYGDGRRHGRVLLTRSHWAAAQQVRVDVQLIVEERLVRTYRSTHPLGAAIDADGGSDTARGTVGGLAVPELPERHASSLVPRARREAAAAEVGLLRAVAGEPIAVSHAQ